MAERRELMVARVGAQADGVADDAGLSIFVPYTLPGERIIAEVEGERARLIDVLTPGPARADPVCRHFGRCGGCSAQHMTSEFYRSWKRDLVVAAFRARGLEVEAADLIAPPGKRRRAVFTSERRDGVVALGFYEAASHALVSIEECPVLEPIIVAAIPELRDLIAPLLAKRGELRVTVTLTKSGLDVEIDGTERRLTPELRGALAASATRLRLARLTVAGETVCEMLPPFLTFGTVEVVLPPDVFVQAMAQAEAEMARRVVEAVGRARSVADLFSGIGAFTFPLAASSRVAAFDGSRPAIAALTAAAKKATGLKPVSACPRDLFREPLSALELNEHEAVVFDPPRAGAEAQAKKLARAKVKTVVAISCNPATLARDARHLVDGGYAIESVIPIDQFVYSPHVEVVAVFRR
jgi:23S rRNA (uracil1939-C5)-methyltransferase